MYSFLLPFWSSPVIDFSMAVFSILISFIPITPWVLCTPRSFVYFIVYVIQTDRSSLSCLNNNFVKHWFTTVCVTILAEKFFLNISNQKQNACSHVQNFHKNSCRKISWHAKHSKDVKKSLHDCCLCWIVIWGCRWCRL